MTRELLGAGAESRESATERVIDVDLGELPHLTRPQDRLARPSTAARSGTLAGRARGARWHLVTAFVATALCAAAVGWQLNGHAGGAADRPMPSVLAWATYTGPDLDGQPGRPTATLRLHVANVGADVVEVSSVASTTDSGVVTAQLVGARPVRIAAGQSAVSLVSIDANCVSDYGHAWLSLAVRARSPEGVWGPIRSVRTVSGPQLGDPYLSVLNELCDNTLWPTQEPPPLQQQPATGGARSPDSNVQSQSRVRYAVLTTAS